MKERSGVVGFKVRSTAVERITGRLRDGGSNLIGVMVVAILQYAYGQGFISLSLKTTNHKPKQLIIIPAKER
ncbi:MAG: hypothetical protein ABJ092_14460 [Gillisia sp.]